MRHLLSLVAMGAAISALTGCAWLFGHAEVPQPRPAFELASAEAALTEGPLVLVGTWLGPGAREVVDRNLWGRVGTVVNPYGADTLLVKVVATNRGPEPLVLLPQEATLALGEGAPRRARTIDDYRRRWPSWAVTSDQERDHRAAAYNFVVDTLLLERQVTPGASAAGLLAFPEAAAGDPVVLKVPYRVARERREATLSWRLR